MNSPIPDFLITIQLGNKPIAVAIDKAIKVIVLANILSEQGKMNVPDQKLLKGTREAEPLLAALYEVDNYVSSTDYKNIVEPSYREYIDWYLRHGGK
jgi:hypothetical protein